MNKKFPRIQPILKVHGSDSLLLPNPNDGKITLKKNDKLDICCPGGCETQKCFKDELYKTDDANANIVNSTDEWTCLTKFELEVVSENRQCLGSGTWLKSGLKYGGTRFLELYRVCYNTGVSSPMLVVHSFDKFYLKQQPNVDCPDTWFHRGYFDTIGNPNAKYKKSNANNAIRDQLGSDANTANTISSTDPSSSHFLAKGHLAPMGDFVFAPEKLGTCSLVRS